MIFSVKSAAAVIYTGNRKNFLGLFSLFGIRVILYIICLINFFNTDGKELILNIWVIIGMFNGCLTILYIIMECYTINMFMEKHNLKKRLNKNVQAFEANEGMRRTTVHKVGRSKDEGAETSRTLKTPEDGSAKEQEQNDEPAPFVRKKTMQHY